MLDRERSVHVPDIGAYVLSLSRKYCYSGVLVVGGDNAKLALSSVLVLNFLMFLNNGRIGRRETLRAGRRVSMLTG